jgi:hypothetical protein
MRLLILAMLATVASAAYADSGMKPGLWEMRIVKTVVDGHDNSAQMAQMNERMQAQLAKMSPEQRAQMSSMMGQHGMGMPSGDGAVVQMCITPEMAKREAPPTSRDESCQPTIVQRSGSHATYTLNCTSGRTKTTGTGEWTVGADKVTSRSDLTVVERGESHHVQSESEFRFLKSECGAVKPASEAHDH